MGTPSSHSRIPRPINFSPTNENGACTAGMVTRGTIDGFRRPSLCGALLCTTVFTRLRSRRVPEPAGSKINKCALQRTHRSMPRRCPRELQALAGGSYTCLGTDCPITA
jgi:hypothetical protein